MGGAMADSFCSSVRACVCKCVGGGRTTRSAGVPEKRAEPEDPKNPKKTRKASRVIRNGVRTVPDSVPSV
ncbi:hypothetical protein GCM10009654_38960 [Streptomyces hebeiensis]|uniref:Uncharacterized protein n=1 Tax=Streptomyces hebeiensis TaxID=229486 RepID=A0ABN1UYZ8_9ACTN